LVAISPFETSCCWLNARHFIDMDVSYSFVRTLTGWHII
jgi:hypothetical protein